MSALGIFFSMGSLLSSGTTWNAQSMAETVDLQPLARDEERGLAGRELGDAAEARGLLELGQHVELLAEEPRGVDEALHLARHG